MLIFLFFFIPSLHGKESVDLKRVRAPRDCDQFPVLDIHIMWMDEYSYMDFSPISSLHHL